jgi:hypothetical protein
MLLYPYQLFRLAETDIESTNAFLKTTVRNNVFQLPERCFWIRKICVIVSIPAVPACGNHDIVCIPTVSACGNSMVCPQRVSEKLADFS